MHRRVHPTSLYAAVNTAFQKDGSATVTVIVLMEVMRRVVPKRSTTQHAVGQSSNVVMVFVFRNIGFVMMNSIVMMARMNSTAAMVSSFLSLFIYIHIHFYPY